MSRRIAVIGLGYVGLPVAVAFAKKSRVIGFDINEHRLQELRQGQDRTFEVNEADLQEANIVFTNNVGDLKSADFFIVTVPTPIDLANRPDFGPLEKASESVAKILKVGDIVVYESTVYPGATEEICVPILEKCSGLKCGQDFTVGYSPERINPGDKEHTFTKIRKVVAGLDEKTLNIVADTYGSVVTAGIFKASSIKVAEAAKVIENTQRDINIALMNELALLFDRLNIDTLDVLEAAGTKWNFIPFRPGFVGGHCIGVDPYYLTHKAEQVGYHPQVILAGRRINNMIAHHVAYNTIQSIVQAGHNINNATITILGLTFKEDCPDVRNTKVIDLINELKKFNVNLQICDPWARPEEAAHEYGIELIKLEDLKPAAGVIFAVGHKYFKDLTFSNIKKLCAPKAAIIDVKGILDRNLFSTQNELILWRL